MSDLEFFADVEAWSTDRKMGSTAVPSGFQKVAMSADRDMRSAPSQLRHGDAHRARCWTVQNARANYPLHMEELVRWANWTSLLIACTGIPNCKCPEILLVLVGNIVAKAPHDVKPNDRGRDNNTLPMSILMKGVKRPMHGSLPRITFALVHALDRFFHGRTKSRAVDFPSLYEQPKARHAKA